MMTRGLKAQAVEAALGGVRFEPPKYRVRKITFRDEPVVWHVQRQMRWFPYLWINVKGMFKYCDTEYAAEHAVTEDCAQRRARYIKKFDQTPAVVSGEWKAITPR